MDEYDEDYEEGYENWYYDDGSFCDDGNYEEYDNYDIPTYDELDLEGRYYTYGSREDYNEWRSEQIQAMQQANSQNTAGNRQYQAQGGCLSIIVILFFSFIAFALG